MIFTKAEAGVVIPGATVNSATEQTIEILRFAWRQGYEIDIKELEAAKNELSNGDLSPDDYEALEFHLEDALDYLNTNCVDKVVFTFVDTDFVLLDSNYEGMVE
jgi:hypothetical protein